MVDAIYAMRAVMGQAQIVPGGGATEFHLASHIRNLANNHESGLNIKHQRLLFSIRANN